MPRTKGLFSGSAFVERPTQYAISFSDTRLGDAAAFNKHRRMVHNVSGDSTPPLPSTHEDQEVPVWTDHEHHPSPRRSISLDQLR